MLLVQSIKYMISATNTCIFLYYQTIKKEKKYLLNWIIHALQWLISGFQLNCLKKDYYHTQKDTNLQLFVTLTEVVTVLLYWNIIALFLKIKFQVLLSLCFNYIEANADYAAAKFLCANSYVCSQFCTTTSRR